MTDFSEIPFNKPFVSGKELLYVTEAIQQGQLSGDGPFTKRCQSWLETRLKCYRAFLTPSCSASLEIAAILIDTQPGDEIIMPSFTFPSTANAFVLRGGIPVFVDIRPDTLNINAGLIDAAVTARTRAIVPVHYGGMPCAMNEITDIAKRYSFWVVEDAAEALLSTYEGRSLGTIGHLGCFSFHDTKNIISGEGGALIVNDERLVERAEVIREKGTNRSRFLRGEIDRYNWIDIGSSFLPAEIISAFLYAQLEQADTIVAERRRICGRYRKLLQLLAEKDSIQLPRPGLSNTSGGHISYIICRSTEERTRLIAFLKKRKINAAFHYVPLHSSPAGKKYGRSSGTTKFTDDISNRLLRLPVNYGIRDADVDRVVEGIFDFFSHPGR